MRFQIAIQYGFRRRPYILGGWIVAISLSMSEFQFAIKNVFVDKVFSLLSCVITLGQPYQNADAWRWLIYFFLINFAYVIADVAMDRYFLYSSVRFD